MAAKRKERSLARLKDRQTEEAAKPSSPTSEPEPFYLYDRNGDAHKYVVRFTPAGPGFNLALELLHIFGEELALLEGVEEFKGKSPVQILALAGQGVGGVAFKILEIGGYKKAQEIMRYTKRDGKDLDSAHWAFAYTGNIAECAAALVKIVAINYADFFGEGSPLNGISEALEDALESEASEP